MPRSSRRIAHVLCWPNVGGTEVATLRLAQALSTEEFTHIAFCAHGDSPVPELFSASGFEAVSCTLTELGLRRPLPFLKSSLRLARQLKALRIDLVHCSDVMSGIHATFAARLAGLPVVCHVRNPHEQLAARARLQLRAVTHFVFVSRHVRDHFALAVPNARASIIYDGLDLPDVSHSVANKTIRGEFEIPPQRKLVGMAARLAAQKDYPTLIRAARRVLAIYPDAHFFVIGDHSSTPSFAEHYRNLQGLTTELGVASHVTFTGFRADVPALLAAMDVVVLATHFEGFGLVLLEAMAHGRPVVATAVGGILEFVRHDETGLLHRHEDDGDLALQIVALLRDEGRAMRLGEAGRQLVKTDFTTERFAGLMGAVYRSLLS